MQMLAFLHHCPSFSHSRVMINQRFGEGVSNLSTVAELRTFDGIILALCVENMPVRPESYKIVMILFYLLLCTKYFFNEILPKKIYLQ